MNDRELLTLAAKAAGIEIVDCTCRHEQWPFKYAEGQGRRGHWNPLTDDGDALRLAVKLNMDTLYYSDDDWEHCNRDGYAATRRAIVRAAAALAASEGKK